MIRNDRIPLGWELVTLGDIANVTTGGTPNRNRPDYWGGTIPWVATGEIDFNMILEPTEFITEEGLKNSSAKLFPKGTLLIAMFGQGVTRGKVALLGMDAAFNQACSAIVPQDGDLADFLFHHLAHHYHRIRGMGQSGTQSNLNASLIRSIPLLRPPVVEQRTIASIAATWDSAIETTKKLIAAKKKLKKGLMQQLLTGKRRLRGFRNSWQDFHLGDLFTERNEENRPDLPLTSITNDRGVIPFTELGKKDSSTEDKSKYKRIMPGDIGYNTMRMWQGVSALSHLDGIVSPAYTICIPSEKIDGRFAAYLFKFPPMVHLFHRYSQGLVSDTLNLKFYHFALIRVTIPTIEEQRAIVHVLSDIDSEISLLSELLESYQKQKNGLMQKLLTGIIRVST